jgi:AcrR family transcriptional regulator
MTDRQIEIINIAASILTKNGIQGLTTKNIAQEMNFSESAIYRHFKNKEEIVVAMLQLLNDKMIDISEIRNESKPSEKIQKIIENQFEYFDKNRHYVTAVFIDGILERSEKIENSIKILMENRKKKIIPLIEEAQKNKEISQDIPSEQLIHIIMGSIRLLMYKWKTNDFKFDIKKEGKTLLTNLFILMKNK